MLKILISVKDNVAEMFNDPRAEVNAGSAIRAFTQSIKDSPHKDDYTLYQVGTIDTNSGVIQANEPLRLYSGHDVKVDNVVDLPEMVKPQSN